MTASKFLVINKKFHKWMKNLGSGSLDAFFGTHSVVYLIETASGKYKNLMKRLAVRDKEGRWSRGEGPKQTGPWHQYLKRYWCRAAFFSPAEKPRPVELEVLKSLARWKSVAVDRRPDAASRADASWRWFFGQATKQRGKKPKAVWSRTAGRDIPQLSRGYKDDTMEGREGPPHESGPRTRRRRLRDGKTSLASPREGPEGDGPVNALAVLDFGSDVSGTREPENVALPPPHRCRLSCPLPPAEFNDILSSACRPKTALSQGDASQKDFSLSGFEKETSLDEMESKWKRRLSRNGNMRPFERAGFRGESHRLLKESPKMKALMFAPDNLFLNYGPVNAPTKIHKDEVLVQVTYSGVCGTDFHITEGQMSCGRGPLILGHEISGKVYAAGSDVHQVKVGENVAVNPYNACCTCRYCTMGVFSCCLREGPNNSIGISKDGGWAEYIVVKKTQIHKVPTELGLDQAALVHPLSCVLCALYKLDISPGAKVLIQGLGMAGCLWASVLHFRGHKNVFAFDKSRKRRQQFLALNLGYDLAEPEVACKVGADVVIECTGSAASMEKCLRLLNANGQMCFFGKPSPTTEIKCIPYDIVSKEIRLLGCNGNSFCFGKAVDLATAMGYRYLDFDKLGVRVFDLQDFKEAFQLMKSGEVSKAMFKLNS